MKNKAIFFLLLNLFFCNAESLQFHSINEFKESIVASQNKKAFIESYIKDINYLDREVNSIISLYDTAQIYKSYVYSKNKEWQGVPIIIKDNIDSQGLANTAGSLSMLDNFPRRDAHLVNKLKKSGFLVVGKANLSEWANFRGRNSVSGWSSYGGQTRNPYNLDYNPCGSSSGSAAAVALGLIPVSIGTETNGSITCPASINGVVGIKPTVGLVSRYGIIPISSTQDTAGPMARNVYDAAVVLKTISGKDPKDKATYKIPSNFDFSGLINLNKNYLKGKKIGLIHPSKEDLEITFTLINKAKEIFLSSGAEIVPITLKPLPNNFWSSALFILEHEFFIGLNDYLKRSKSSMKNMQSIVDFNNANKKETMSFYGQEYFISSIAAGPGKKIGDEYTDEIYQEALEIVKFSRTYIDKILIENELDAIVGLTRNTAWKIDYQNGDNFENGWGNGALSAISGYPHITIPLALINDFPTGLSFMGTAWDEVNLVNLAYSFEQENNFFPKPTINKN